MGGTHGEARQRGARRGRRIGFVTILASAVIVTLLGGSTAAVAGRPAPTDADVRLDLPAAVSGHVGGIIWLGVQVANAGPATATNIVVTLEFPTGLNPVGLPCTASSTGSTCRYVAGSVPAGNGVAPILELRASAAGAYPVRGQVTADQPDPAPADNVDATVVDVTELADVSIDLPTAVSGQIGGFTLLSVAVGNAGPTTATGVLVTLEFPAGLNPIGLSCAPNGTGSVCRYPGGSQPSGTGSIALIRLEATAAGTYTVRGQVTADQPDPVATNNSDSAVVEMSSVADLAVQVADSADPSTAGRPLTYTVTIDNQGPSPASAVLLTDTWLADTPGGAELLSVRASQGSCQSTAPQRIDCRLGTLASGASATVTVSLRPRGIGVITDQTSVSATEPDPDTANNTDSEATTIAAP